jgi:hypothetical protein
MPSLIHNCVIRRSGASARHRHWSGYTKTGRTYRDTTRLPHCALRELSLSGTYLVEYSLGYRANNTVSLQLVGRLKLSDGLVCDRAKITIDI